MRCVPCERPARLTCSSGRLGLVSMVLAASVLLSSAEAAPPSAPKLSDARFLGSGTVQVDWAGASGALAYWVLHYHPDSGYRFSSQLSTTTYSHTVRGLADGDNWFQVWAGNYDGYSQSEWRYVLIGKPPTAPAGLRADAIAPDRIQLRWTDSRDETGYRVWWSIDGGRNWQNAAVAANTTQAVVGSLAPRSTVTFYAEAFNSAGSAWSDGVSATTPAAASSEITLTDVPYVSQNTGKANNLCQFACAAMLLGQRHGTKHATTKVAQEIARLGKGTPNPPQSSVVDAKTGLDRYINDNIGTSSAKPVVNALSFDDLKTVIGVSKRGVSVSASYKELGNYRFLKTYNGGHQVVVIGFSEKNQTWTYLDPLGGKKTVPSDTFRRAVITSDSKMWALYFE